MDVITYPYFTFTFQDRFIGSETITYDYPSTGEANQNDIGKGLT